MNVNKAEVMQRAWAIFRGTYNFPQNSFRSIGRNCFAWALKTAWFRLRAEAKALAMSAAEKLARLSALKEEMFALEMQDANLFQAHRRMDALRVELASLQH